MLATALSSHAINTLSIDRASAVPVYQQLCAQFRELIEGRRLVAGVRLPSSRDLARELGVSRKTVVITYDQLMSEGYLTGRQGAGTYVEEIPEISTFEEADLTSSEPVQLQTDGRSEPRRLLAPSMPDMNHFPRSAWSRASARGQRKLDLDSMFHGSTTGYAPLRKAIADHLRAMRGLLCQPDQVIITSGLVESMRLIGTSLFTTKSVVVREDPGFTKTAKSLDGIIDSMARVSVDQEGLDVDMAISNFPNAEAIIVTPSRQFPLGMQLSLNRRAALVNWASEQESWIIEDDYDCEYRFTGRPIQSIYSLDKAQRTIYLGSLSKVLFPQLRISFIVAPHEALEKIAAQQQQIGSLASMLTQAALCEFMTCGQFSTHLRQMRRLYQCRYDYIFEAVQMRLGKWITPQRIGGGTQFAARFNNPLPSGIADLDIVEETNAAGLGVYPLSMFYAEPNPMDHGLVIGFASTSEENADRGISVLEKVFRERL